MSDSSTTLVPKRIFIEPAEREQMEKRITSWMIEKGWIEAEISDCVLSEGGGRRQAFNQPLTGWKLRTQDTYHMFYYSSYSHLETLIMAAASSGTDYTPAGYRANVKEQLKNLCGRFGKETVRSALIEYKDKYATGTLLNALEEME